jgi:hypothetical protein
MSDAETSLNGKLGELAALSFQFYIVMEKSMQNGSNSSTGNYRTTNVILVILYTLYTNYLAQIKYL